jgi:hypothetical protein
VQQFVLDGRFAGLYCGETALVRYGNSLGRREAPRPTRRQAGFRFCQRNGSLTPMTALPFPNLLLKMRRLSIRAGCFWHVGNCLQAMIGRGKGCKCPPFLLNFVDSKVMNQFFLIS